ncbi:MAG: hypothetical protein KC731_18940 [Myxococcales bacterium]|nr:hypothetical protein [Myxococcales bacterium]
MLQKHPRLVLASGGGLFGLLLGLGYWFVWGCRSCAKDNSPVAIVSFFVVVCAVMAARWGRDHIQPPPPF